MIGEKTAAGGTPPDDPSADVGATFGRIAESMGGLLQDSTDLVRLTVREEIQSVLRRLFGFMMASVAALVGLLLIANGLALYLSHTLGRPGGYLVVGLAFLLIAATVAYAVMGSGGGKKR